MRALRELGREVAVTHAAAFEAQIRVLKVHRALLLITMHDLTRRSEAQRRQILSDFLDEVSPAYGTSRWPSGCGPRFPELPDDPTPAQLQAWIELAELVGDPEFPSHEMALRGAGRGDSDAMPPERAAAVAERAGAAVAREVAPGSPEAEAMLADLIGRPRLDPEARGRLAEQIDVFADARVERYWELIGELNGWPRRERVTPAWKWLAEALRAVGEPARDSSR